MLWLPAAAFALSVPLIILGYTAPTAALSIALLLPDGRPKVADFGLAKDLEGASGLTQGGSPGTLNYLSPEQIDRRFGKVGERSDVYAFGATLYEALTLTRLHPGDEPAPEDAPEEMPTDDTDDTA